MPVLIKGSDIVQDGWKLIDRRDIAPCDLPDGDLIVPMSLWLSQRDALSERDGEVAVWIDADDEPEQLAQDVSRFKLIAVNFPTFADGTGLSTAVLLRTRFGYKGELRAIGDVRRDWLSYMRRCGFDSYLLPTQDAASRAVGSLVVMSDYYQGSVVEPSPLFRRKLRS